MNVEVRRYHSDMAGDWNSLVASARNGLFLFDRNYMDYHADRFEDFSAMAWLDGRPAALLPASIDRQSGLVTSHAGLTFGGLLVDRAMRGTSTLNLLDAALDAMREWGAEALEMRMMPAFLEAYPSGEVGYGLWRRGFELVRRDLSSVLPLSEPLAVNSNKRRTIAKAMASGLQAVEGHLPAYHRLLTEVLADRHQVKPVHSLDELERLVGAFPENILLRTVEVGGDAIAGALIFRYPTAWHTQYLASSPTGRNNGALDLVIASLIDEAREDGAAWLSFGTSTTDAGRSLNEGLLWQKESFGARSVTHDVMRGAL